MKSKKKSDEKAQVIEIVVDTEDTMTCLLYTSDAADDDSGLDLGGRGSI